MKGLPRQEKSPVLASRHKGLKFAEVAANKRRLFVLRGGGGRRYVLITEEADGPLACDEDQGACVTYKKAKDHGVGQKKKDGSPEVVGIKCEVMGRP